VSRSLDTSLAAALSNANIQPVILAALTFVSGVVYVWSGVGDLVWNDNTYLGVGALGNISAIHEGTSVQADGMTVTLSGLPLPGNIPYSGGGVSNVTDVSVPATSMPWSATTYNATNYPIGDGSGYPASVPGTDPIVLYSNLAAGQQIAVTASGTTTYEDGSTVGPEGVSPTDNPYPGQPAGPQWPISYVQGYGTTSAPSGTTSNHGCLILAFTDGDGNLIEAYEYHDDIILTVPGGATQLQLGTNSWNWTGSTAGSFTVSAGPVNPVSGQFTGDVLDDIQIGAPAQVWFGLMSDGALIGSPYLVFSGTVDQPSIKVSPKTTTISLALENRLSNLQRAQQQRYTSADQRLQYPDDTSMSWVETMNDIALRWGS